MSQFHEQSWASRYAVMGDEAEELFALLHPNSAPFGLRRPKVNLSKVPPFIRFMPDFLLHNRLVECMGVGNDQVLKLKLAKLAELLNWHEHHPVQLFIWDSHKRRHGIMEIGSVASIAALCPRKFFPEGHEYYAIPLDVLSIAWTELPEDA